jgi:hypothetical protein
MTAVLTWARLDLRRRWRSLAVLTLLVSLAGGVVIGSAAGARRTDTVARRLDARIGPPTVMVLANQPGFNWATVAKLPGVARLGKFVLTGGSAPIGVGINLEDTIGFPAGDLAQNVSIERPTILSGRRANPLNPNEIVVTPGFIHRYGRVITMRLPTKAQVARLPQGAAFPPGFAAAGPTVHLHVVGVGINTFDLAGGGGTQTFEPTYAFFRDYIKPLFPYFENALVQLRGGPAAIPEFTRELTALTHNSKIEVVDFREQLHVLTQAESFAAVGWLLFAAAALLASLVLVGQAFVRFSAAASDDLRTLAALGLDRRAARLAAGTGPMLATLLGMLIATGVAIALSPLFPTGLARGFEPTPGVRVDGLALGLGALAVMALGLAGSWWAAHLAVRDVADPDDRRSLIATAARRAGLGVSAVLGTCFALEPGRGKSRVPVRPALVGAVAGVLGIVGALTFRAGLDSTISNPERFGQTLLQVGFVSLGGAPPPSFQHALGQAATDPDIAVLDNLRVDVLPVDGRPSSVFSLSPVKGTVKVVTLAGRAPHAANEISLGPTTAKALHVQTGSTVHIGTHALTVTGITFVPEDLHNNYDDGAWLTTAGFNTVQPDLAKDTFHEVRFNFRPGVNTAAATKRLPRALAPGGVSPLNQFVENEQVIELHSVRLQPLLLGAFLLLLALGAVGHALASAVRRRRHDLAILRSLGLTRRQTRLIVAVQASVIAAVGLVFGVPLGIAAGRSSWRGLADTTPVYYVAPLAALAVLLAVPVTVAVANLLAALPARRAARLQVGQILRAE